MNDRERHAEVVSLWLSQYPSDKRILDNTFGFYGWVRDNRPELLKHRCADKYRQLKADLQGHIRDTGKS